jgi:hypothetical protein
MDPCVKLAREFKRADRAQAYPPSLLKISCGLADKNPIFETPRATHNYSVLANCSEVGDQLAVLRSD